MTPFEQAVSRFKGKKVLVLGIGLLGGAVGDARFFKECGADVRVTDKKDASKLKASVSILESLGIPGTYGAEDPKDITWADYVIRNPGVPQNHPLLNVASSHHIPVLMRSSLFVELSKIPVIGITGTRGKTTTSTMIYELLEALSGKKVFLCGNVAGVSDLELLKLIKNPKDSIAVMELSSWQLQGFLENKISPHISVITNLYPDHLNMYPNLNAYYQDKLAIISHQTENDYAVLNRNQPEFKLWSETIQSRPVWFDDKTLPPELKLSIPGSHNRLNASAALTVAMILGLPKEESISILKKFKGVPFRLEIVSQKRGVTYINDTTATTPVATITALKSLDKKPILILGGADKNLPIDELVQEINVRKIKCILLSGNGTDRLKLVLDNNLIEAEVNTMSEAVSKASEISKDGDIVLLSPGFASFGLFNNEFDRGNQFNQCVQRLP